VRTRVVTGDWVWRFLGYGFFALGAVGAVLPLLPTTGPWILSVICLAKGRDPLSERLLGHPKFGPALCDYVDHGRISRSGKICAVSGMGMSFLLTAALGAGGYALLLLAGVLSFAMIWVVTRTEPRKH